MVSYVRNCYLYDTNIKPKKHNWKPFESRKVRTKMTNPREVCYAEISSENLKLDLDNSVHMPGKGHLVPLKYNGASLKIAVIPEVQYVKTRDNVYNNKKILILNPSLLTKSIKVLKKFINNNIGSLSEFGVKSLEKIMPVDEDKIFAKVTRGSEFFDKSYLHLDGLDQVCQKGEAKFCIEIDNIFVKENYVSIQIKVLDMIITKENVNIRRGPLIDISR
ncbi:hypothetical protein IWW40_005265 [Coemansia sp. RSA 1250]|nr:hypothetical protein IWW40_005265 [Coemansia sp. RSA 1250]